MSTDFVRRFSNQEVLHGIGRNLLIQFLAPFEADLAASPISAFQLASPARTFSVSAFASLPNEPFFTAVACLIATATTDSTPSLAPFRAALSQIAELSIPGTAEADQKSLGDLGFQIEFPPGSSPEHKAFLMWFGILDALTSLAQPGISFRRLQEDGPDSLEPTGEILAVRLEGVKVVSENAFQQTSATCAHDTFKSAAAESNPDPVPKIGMVAEATFHFSFSYACQPHRVQIRPPDVVELEHLRDAIPVVRWMCQRHFTIQSLAA